MSNTQAKHSISTDTLFVTEKNLLLTVYNLTLTQRCLILVF